MAPKALKTDIVLREMERTPGQDDERRRQLGFAIKFVSLLILFLLMFLLARSMVEHHFFSGGAMNYHNSPTGP